LDASVKEVCCLWAQQRIATLNQFLIIFEVLRLQPVLQVSKQVAVAKREIRDTRW
jgi:hypothetical protein